LVTECDDNTIYIGFGLMKGFGPSVLKKLRLMDRNHKDIVSFMKNVFRCGLPKQIVEALVLCGSLDRLSANRQQSLKLYEDMSEAARGVKTKTQILKRTGEINPKWQIDKDKFDNPSITELADWSIKEKGQKEREVLGLYVRRNKLKDREKEIMEQTDEGRIDQLEDGEEVKLLGELTKVVVKMDKNGRDMAITDFKTLKHGIKLMVFAKEFARLKPLMRPGTKLVIRAKFQDSEKFGQSYILNAAKEDVE